MKGPTVPDFKRTKKYAILERNRGTEQTSTAEHECFDFVKSDDYVAGRTLAKRAEVASDNQGEGEYGRGHRRIKTVHRNCDSSES
ncbi:hypothetical protein O3P69_004036 [Scylla paramamosain]|uniref:Uncharacterized protein n=1 Tax=Scylla paramamosain TaxID=85552 RepID=A0AAW0UGL7_SCYPA